MSDHQHHHHSSKSKWKSKLSRSLSTSTLPRPPTHNATNSPRPSPPSAATMTTIPSDGADLAPPSPSMTPKKSWERHYKSFLRGRRFLPPEKLSPPDLESKEVSASRKLFGKHKHSSSKKSPKPAPQTVMDGDALATEVQLPDLSSKSKSKSVGFLHPHSKSSEAAVRGGSLFGSVFKRDRSSSSMTTEDESSGGSNSHHRHKNVDSLDAAIRKGRDVAYSPDNARFQRKIVDNTMPSRSEPPGYTDDLEGSVRGGVSRRTQHTQSHLPSSLARHQQQRDSPTNRSKEMKVAFTEFHNSSEFQDSTSAYLGDEPSQHGNDRFSTFQHSNSNALVGAFEAGFSSRYSEGNLSFALSPVAEDVVPLKTTRVLCPLLGTETWSAGRRYLIAPAAVVMCPNQILPVLSGNAEKSIKYPQELDGSFPVFGSVLLGTATVTHVGRSRPGGESYGWSSCVFVLRQNYLLEYAPESSLDDVPRGFAHLQHSVCQAHENFHDALHLQFYTSPCAKAGQRTLMIRVKSRQERDWWVSRLASAAQLTIEDLYEFDNKTKFGDGRYAKVLPARKKRTNSNKSPTDLPHDCALKVIDKQEFWYRVQKGRERADTLVREVSVQATLSAKCGRLPTFLQIRGFFETCDNVVVELELLEGIDLFQYVCAKGTLKEDEAAHVVRDLLTSLDAMQRIGIAHRDVKPANILMCDRTRHGVSVKIGDYGMSTFVGVDGLVRGRCGTPGYVAPEIFGAGVHGGYGNKVDVFSAGVTLYVMLCGYEPFYGESDAELIAANRNADVEFAHSDWGDVSEEAMDLIKRMLEPDPRNRIGAREALQHSWIEKYVRTTPWNEIGDFVDQWALECKDVSPDSACTTS